MAVLLFYLAPAAAHDGLPALRENNTIFSSATYSQCCAVMKAYERGTFFHVRRIIAQLYFNTW